MLWLFFERLYYRVNRKDRYQAHLLAVFICVGLAFGYAFGHAFGHDVMNSLVGVIPWSVFLGLLLSDLIHAGTRLFSSTDMELERADQNTAGDYGNMSARVGSDRTAVRCAVVAVGVNH